MRALLSSYADDTGVIDEAAASAVFAQLASGLPSRGGSTRTSLSGLPVQQPPGAAASASVSSPLSGDWSTGTLRPGEPSVGPETAASAMPYAPPPAAPGRTSSSGVATRTQDARGGGAHVARSSLLSKALINNAIEKSMSGVEGGAEGGGLAQTASQGSLVGGAGGLSGGGGSAGGAAGAGGLGSEVFGGELEGGFVRPPVLDPVSLCAVRAALQVGYGLTPAWAGCAGPG